jgi:hypothetical protein
MPTDIWMLPAGREKWLCVGPALNAEADDISLKVLRERNPDAEFRLSGIEPKRASAEG